MKQNKSSFRSCWQRLASSWRKDQRIFKFWWKEDPLFHSLAAGAYGLVLFLFIVNLLICWGMPKEVINVNTVNPNAEKETFGFVKFIIYTIITIFSTILTSIIVVASLRPWRRLKSRWRKKFNPWWEKNPLINSLIIGICALGLFLVIIMFLTCEGGIFAWLLGTDSKKATIEFIALGIGGILATIGAIAINNRANAQVTGYDLDRQKYDHEQFASTMKGFLSALQNSDSDNRLKRRSAFYQFYYLAERTENEAIKSDIYGILEARLWRVAAKCELLKDTNGFPEKTEDYIMERHTLLGILFKEYAGQLVFQPDGKTWVDLQSVWLMGADLSDAKLIEASISDATFTSANLSDANLSKANLSGADFSGEEPWDEEYWDYPIVHNLYMGKGLDRIKSMGAGLLNANLSNADLSDANLSNANLSDANLSDANLLNADLLNADLSNANIQKAQLEGANLHDVYSIEQADFRGAKIGNDPITKNDIPENKGKYYADWTESPPTKPHNPQKNKKKLRIAPAKSEGDKV